MKKISLLTSLFVLLLAAPAGANVREIGLPTDQPFPPASCPADCRAVGGITGYQVQLGATKNPFLINKEGKIVAFTIRLGKPDAQAQQFFENLFGGRAQARLSVLKLARTNRRARLKAQSEIFDLTPYFGSTPTFALDKPLEVGPRTVVALTLPTWAPAFQVNLASDNAWRSSRDADSCGDDDLRRPAAQQTLNSLRTYGCFYRTARLLYSATYVPKPEESNPQTPAAGEDGDRDGANTR